MIATLACAELSRVQQCMRLMLAKEHILEEFLGNMDIWVAEHHPLLKVPGDGVIDLGEDNVVLLHPR